jgi:DnaJ-domain-containing protein 1
MHFQRRLPGNRNILSMRLAAAAKSSEQGDKYYKGMDAYQILEVPRTATMKEIKSAYKKGRVIYKIL